MPMMKVVAVLLAALAIGFLVRAGELERDLDRCAAAVRGGTTVIEKSGRVDALEKKQDRIGSRSDD